MPTPCGQKKSFPTKKHRLQVTSAFNTIFDVAAETDQTPCVDTQRLPIQFLLHDRASGMSERHPVPPKFLQNKTFATKETSAKSVREGNAHSSLPIIP